MCYCRSISLTQLYVVYENGLLYKNTVHIQRHEAADKKFNPVPGDVITIFRALLRCFRPNTGHAAKNVIAKKIRLVNGNAVLERLVHVSTILIYYVYLFIKKFWEAPLQIKAAILHISK
jgi:hypothetical protein